MTGHKNTFEKFATVEAHGSSPLYETLSLSIADDEEILALTGEVPADQPAPNLLFAAVQYLLFERPDEVLADYFPNTSELSKLPREGAYEAFRNFCLSHRDDIISLLQSRRVQTNVISRSSILLPVFEYLSRRCNRIPLGVVEIGPSAGLNLLFDKYGYQYGRYGKYGDPKSPVQLSCEVRGDEEPPLPKELPLLGKRLGIDLNTLDVRNEDDVRWLRALIWPEHEERRNLIEGAVSVARESPPELIEGNALTDLENVCSEVPENEQLCIFNTHVLYQFTVEQQEEFAELFGEIGQSRDLFWANCEWHGDEPEVRFVEYVDGTKSIDVLALYDSHGRWIEWC
ncbi:DUF2332 domain-containing protein [Natronosalvus rutilus]|uniref:DUF2332 domain-containing protein n=1 Tax=Natronosalvus rutilus TaxID=2953753 RepID=A0A9E7N8Q8_9EURY|nr:DUF2332 domain-containing protein [Natronosalvus rutilus]UTF52413.1 DUF2332 domain-containing protein [Natronosalvus rutilus]